MANTVVDFVDIAYLNTIRCVCLCISLDSLSTFENCKCYEPTISKCFHFSNCTYLKMDLSTKLMKISHQWNFYGRFGSWWTKPRRWPRWSSITSWPQTTPSPTKSAAAIPWKTFLRGSRTKTLSRISRTEPPVFWVPVSAAMSVWPSEHLGPHLRQPPLSWETSWRSSLEPYLLRQRYKETDLI